MTLPELKTTRGRRARVARMLVTCVPSALIPGMARARHLPDIPVYSAETGWVPGSVAMNPTMREHFYHDMDQYVALTLAPGGVGTEVIGLVDPRAALPIEGLMEVLKVRMMDRLARLPLRTTQYHANVQTEITYKSATEIGPTSRDAELPEALQDLADELILDVTDACHAIDDPNVYFPGVEEGIEPVTDEHARLVVAAMQRELDRERRPYRTATGNVGDRRPAVELAKLPWNVQRALAERRRLRFKQWGIGRAEWEANEWSLWSVPEDSIWTPRFTDR